jgi:hypothetical protein
MANDALSKSLDEKDRREPSRLCHCGNPAKHGYWIYVFRCDEHAPRLGEEIPLKEVPK